LLKIIIIHHKSYLFLQAVMKIVKHCHEESQGNMEIAQGALLGLAEGNRLEITNCFPFPKSTDETVDEEEYQLAMMRRLRRVNVDHFHVGWYQSSVVVVYDTQKSAGGFLTLKAYRLTPQAIAMYKDGDFTPDALRQLKIGYEKLFVEIPIHIKNSALTNVMMLELQEMVQEEEGSHFLDLGTAGVLENHIRAMMDRVDELYQEASKFNKYQQSVTRQEQDKHRQLNKLAQENAARIAKGETPVPEDEVIKQFRPLPVPPRLNPMIISGQINTVSQHINQFCSQSLAKLYLTEALQGAKETKETK
jgi:translation initiation factor 3 subunit H